MNDFNFYFKGKRYTETEIDFLTKLTDGEENQREIIDGILASKARFDSHTEEYKV